ncbi:unnamed protein product [Caenorhabditis bovis]|uniref:Uncharacterized protein n=1 Tax=Caenorhabditis bovis TaxID=2654633 RepID=A0A8S1FBW1_9PELO|nr:unnamed protein product [Caenorhabditis bovis]
MAVLGFHVVICLIAITLISKLVSRASFVSFFITNGLYRVLAPSNHELKALMPQSKEKLNQRNRRKKRDEEEAEGFNVPKSTPIQLHRAPVDVRDLVQFELYTSLHWICLCVPICFIVYAISETYNYISPQNTDFNVTIILLLVFVGFILQILMSLSSYLVLNVDERGFMLSIGALYFLFSFIFAMSAQRVFDIQMLEAYDTLGKNIAEFVKSADILGNGSTSIADYRPDNPLFLYISLSVFFSMLSAMFLFPNFRCAIMYLKAIENEGPTYRTLSHVTFLIPAVVLALFLKPVTHQIVDGPRKFLTYSQLNILRIYLVIVWLMFKFFTRIPHLQAHLNLSYDKVMDLQKESGKVKNYALQSMILRYYRYICCAAIQYFGPALLAVFFALILKTTGGLSWLGEPVTIDTGLNVVGPIRYVFDVVVCRAFFSFLLVVTLLINFSLQLMGVVYHSYFVKSS